MLDRAVGAMGAVGAVSDKSSDTRAHAFSEEAASLLPSRIFSCLLITAVGLSNKPFGWYSARSWHGCAITPSLRLIPTSMHIYPPRLRQKIYKLKAPSAS